MIKSYIKDYPRPQLVRKNWMNLNGEWDFRFDDLNEGLGEGWFKGFEPQHKITVPFTYETKLSGIGDETAHEVVWYSRKFKINREQDTSGCTLLHFEGSDYQTKVWINGCQAGEHQGGYARFSFDIAPYLCDGENLIVVRIRDGMNPEQPRGKQRWIDENFGCWYVQTTGIWKTVWLETVSNNYIKGVKMTPDLDSCSVLLEANIKENGDDLFFHAKASFGDITVGAIAVKVCENKAKATLHVGNKQVEQLFGIKAWRPDEPNLYDITFTLQEGGKELDRADSYFGMRDIVIKGSEILLDNQPIYQRLILDQGYWEESHMTPPSEEALIEDIDKILQLGYNGLRKHEKVEDERFLFWCDVKGLLVWCEMPSTYRYADDAIENLTKEWMEIVRQNYNHPCIITWTPFNESWGIPHVRTNYAQQAFTQGIYYLTKAFDTMRPVIVNDGWEHTVSDIITLHDYRECGKTFYEKYHDQADDILAGKIAHNQYQLAFADGFKYQGQPVIISEFGGIAYSTKSGWGYGNQMSSEEDFLSRFTDITTAIQKIPYICGFCYTQVSHVQQEINGLMDEQRNFVVDVAKIAEINKRR